LATQLVYGTLAWQSYLDHLIAACSHRPPEDLDAGVRLVLRLALFQISRLTRVPQFAAVDTAVQLIKTYRSGAAAGFVNAVLRRASRDWQQVPLPSRDHDPIGYLATALSHPRWLVERWVAAYGVDDTEALLRANNEAAPTLLRVNRLKTSPAQLLAVLREAGLQAEPARYSPVGIRLDHPGPPERLPGYEAGWGALQGEASQLVGFLVSPQSGSLVLDACAAPGGKATHLAELMDDRGAITAIDIHARGVTHIARLAHRLGLASVHPVSADATRWQPPDAGQRFACVLVDAPCSGLGTLRAHPEVKWRRTANDVARLARLQQQLLAHAAPLVRPGGVLVYATCTLSAAENDEQLATFLATQPQFAIDDPRPLLPESARPLIGSDGVLRTFPHRHGLDGFFAVRLKRREEQSIVRP